MKRRTMAAYITARIVFAVPSAPRPSEKFEVLANPHAGIEYIHASVGLYVLLVLIMGAMREP